MQAKHVVGVEERLEVFLGEELLVEVPLEVALLVALLFHVLKQLADELARCLWPLGEHVSEQLIEE